MPYKDPQKRIEYDRKRQQKATEKRITQRTAQGLPIDMRGKQSRPSPHKGMTYEQMYGKEKADELKLLRGKIFSRANKGRKLSEKVRKQTSIRFKGKTLEQIYGTKAEEVREHRKEARWTPIRKAEQSALAKRVLFAPEVREKNRKIASETLKRLRPFIVFPKKDTKIEVKLQNELSFRGLFYAKHYPIKGQPDIAFPEQKIAIFCDGDYWHNLEKVKKHDLEVNEYLMLRSWVILRYTEKLIHKDVKSIADEIQTLVFKAPCAVFVCNRW